jgi:hypothetical protein
MIPRIKSYKHLLLAALVVLLLTFLPMGFAQADILFPDPDTSNPTNSQTMVLREKGRKGLLFRFRYRDAGNVESNAGFPLDMSSATVNLTIGGNPAIACTSTLNPALSNCSYQVVDGDDADAALDTVKIFYTGSFPASTNIQYSVTGAKASGGTLLQDPASPNVVAFTTGATSRNPASLELVFDISGSMGSSAVPSGTVTRIDALKSAVQSLFNQLSNLALINDKVGAVYFNNMATVFDPTPGPSSTNLEPANNPQKINDIRNDMDAKKPTNATSIGAGLQAANTSGFAADLAAPANVTKTVVLFSDGEQNTDPQVAIIGGNLQVGGANYPAEIKVCPITAGRQTAPGFTLQQNIANLRCATSNAHIRDDQNSFVTADLETYFMQLLGDLLVGDKLELTRDLTGQIVQGTNLTEKFLANKGDVALNILLSWSGEQTTAKTFLPFRLRAPDGQLVDLSNRTEFGNNMNFTTVRFPLVQNGDVIKPAGEWQIELVGEEISAPALDYHLVVMLDNPTIASEFSLESEDVGTGEAIPIRVKLTEGDNPVLNATVVAQLLGPEMGVGDILSTTSTPSDQPDPQGDRLRSEAQAKLLLLLENPEYADLFKNKNLPAVQLLDNGQSANGDNTANDGLYSGRFGGTLEEGHYFFVVNVSGTSDTNGGDFQRTRLLTVFVRPKPSPNNTELTLLSSDSVEDGSIIIRLRATPRDALGNYIGPDYTPDYLSIKSSQGTALTLIDDKLDGSYEISYRLPSAASNPNITVEVMGTPVVTKSLRELQGKLPFWLIILIIILVLILLALLIWLIFLRQRSITISNESEGGSDEQ